MKLPSLKLSLAALALAGCAGSDLSSLQDTAGPNMTVGLVDLAKISPAGINGYKLAATPRGGSCETYTSEAAMPANAMVTTDLNTACEYDVTVAVGKLGSDGKLAKTYYQTSQPYLVKAAHLQSKTRFTPILKVTADGTAAGFSNPTTADAQPLLLTSAQNAAVRGRSGATTVGSLFQGKYMMVEFSQTGCPHCVDLAREHGSDQVYKNLISSKACSSVTLVPRLAPWLALGFDPVVANASHEGAAHTAMAQAFRVNFGGGVPFVFIVDRAGNKVWPTSNETSAYYQRAQAMAKFKELCGAGQQQNHQ